MYTHHFLDLNALAPLLEEVASLRADFGPRVNHRINLVDSVACVDSFMAPLVAGYNQQHRWPAECQVFKTAKNMRLEDLWVNYMGPGQATPIHNHGGVISFCMWLRVPYTRSMELDATPWIPRSDNINGDFAFHTVGDRGIRTIPLGVDRSWENSVAIWPAHLHHSVFPFYSSNELRISVAGNYWFDVD
jgi:hypothetical protein